LALIESALLLNEELYATACNEFQSDVGLNIE